jgi:pimeloyl-ACP methyl ester carboxylesterase
MDLFGRRWYCVVVVAGLLTPLQGAYARIDVTPAPFVPNIDLDLSLALNGTPLADGASLATTTKGAFLVTIEARAKVGGTADWSPDNALDGSEGSQAYSHAFYLDVYRGTLFSDATLVSGEEMNAESPTLRSSSTVTLPGPGTYAAVLYDSEQVRDPSSCSEEHPCFVPYRTLDQVRARLEKGADGLDYPPTRFVGVVTFTISDPCAAPGSCASNVLFLPGIEGSRLYAGVGCGKSEEERLWEPLGESVFGILRGAGDDKVGALALDEGGKSVCQDVYVKAGDIVDSVGGNGLYRSFIDDMNGLRSEGVMQDWAPVAYDWRLSFDDLLMRGAEHAGKVYFEEATSTPYIEQTLRALADSSKTGKVTIIAHSNGGLLAKALLERLGSEVAASLVDRVVLVGAPQTGAPAGIGSVLVGYDAGISYLGFPIVSNAAARAFAHNSPMAYHLLPSAAYLASIIEEPAHPVIHFSGEGFAAERAAYGNSVVDLSTLDDFLLARRGERERPSADDLDSPEVLNETLVNYANGQHALLDAWTPPPGIEVDQIAGWGADTVAGIDFYTLPPTDTITALSPSRAYRPILTEDGDGTVPVPSALHIASSTNVKRYWVDLSEYFKITKTRRTHSDMFEIPSVRDVINNVLRHSADTLPAYVSASQPASIVGDKKLVFYLHSPLTLELQDSSGNVTGLASDGSIREDIPGSTYGEFGEVKYVAVTEGDYHLALHGQSAGTFSLDMEDSSGVVTTLANVPVTANTLVTLAVSGGTLSPMTVDENGDGETTIIMPRAGEVVSYRPPAGLTARETELVTSPISAVSPGSISIPVTALAVAERATPLVSVGPVTAGAAALATQAKPLPKGAVSSRTAPPKVMTARAAQTASAYDAVSQHTPPQGWGSVVYTKLHTLWLGIRHFF